MNPKKVFYKNLANTVIKKLKSRKMDAYYCDSVEEAENLVVELMGEAKKTVAYGGSMTIDDHNFKDKIVKAGHDLIVRENYKTEEELKELKKLTVTSDVFLMSSNAITLDGQLVNIDGRGNRVSYLIYGPEEVFVIAGMNKIVMTVEDGIDRTQNVAAPPNTVRLNRNTPCAECGFCGNCINDSICCQIVVTRVSMIPGRIKVILVGEDLGY